MDVCRACRDTVRVPRRRYSSDTDQPPVAYLCSLLCWVPVDSAGYSWESDAFQPFFLAEQQGILSARYGVDQDNETHNTIIQTAAPKRVQFLPLPCDLP